MKSYKIKQLQFIRFIAFTMIFLYHASIYNNLTICGKLNPSLWAVSFFIILSGFLTSIKYYENVDNITIKNIFYYIKHKLNKIYPLYFVLTLISISLYTFPNLINVGNYKSIIDSIIQLIKNLLLIQSWFPNGYFSFVGVGWFISTMIFLSSVSFPFIRIIKKINKRNNILLLISLIIIILIFELTYAFSFRNMNQTFYNYVFPISRLFEYLIGMLLGIFFLNNKKRNNPYNIYIATLLEILVFVFIFIIMIIPNDIIWIDRISKWIIPNILLIYIYASGNGFISKIFSNRIFVILGDISFESFLIHAIVLLIYYRLNGSLNVLANVFSLLYVYIITIFLSFIVHKKLAIKDI